MFDALTRLARLTFAAPRQAARMVLDWPMERAVLWQLATLLVLLGVVVMQLSNAILPMPVLGPLAMIMANPLLNLLIQGGIFVITVQASYRIGRAAGGTGSLTGALKLMLWLQAITLAVQIVQLLMLMLLPPLGGMIGFASLFLFFWLLTNFVAELHGFASRWRVFMAIVMSCFALFLTLSLALALLFMLIPGGI